MGGDQRRVGPAVPPQRSLGLRIVGVILVVVFAVLLSAGTCVVTTASQIDWSDDTLHVSWVGVVGWTATALILIGGIWLAVRVARRGRRQTGNPPHRAK